MYVLLIPPEGSAKLLWAGRGTVHFISWPRWSRGRKHAYNWDFSAGFSLEEIIKKKLNRREELEENNKKNRKKLPITKDKTKKVGCMVVPLHKFDPKIALRCAQDNLGVKKVLVPSKKPSICPIVCFVRIKKITSPQNPRYVND
jgi:hypothetical protein